MDEFLKSKKVIICAGSGGVGKTTLSAALGVRAAQIGLNVLVLTIDPARRLANALGLESWQTEDTVVPNQEFEGTLSSAMIDSQVIFDQFVRDISRSKEEADSIIGNRLYAQLSTTLNGTQEYTALEKLYKTVGSGKYDLVILDTPPSQHAIEFLNAPQKFYSLFDEAILKWFSLANNPGEGVFRSIFHKGTKIAFDAMERLTGGQFISELFEFFDLIDHLKEPIRQHSIAIHRLLTSEDAAFVLVTSFDEVKINEARDFQKELQIGGYDLGGVIVNRAFPKWMEASNPNQGTNLEPGVVSALKDYFCVLRKYFEKHEEAYSAFEQAVGKNRFFVRVPDFDQDVDSIESLKAITEEVSRHVDQGAAD